MSGTRTIDKRVENASNHKKYPPGLIAEYQGLALKELEASLTSEEQIRLQELIVQIEAIDCAAPVNQEIQSRYDQLEAELEQIRRKAEALLDTGP